MPNDSMIPRPPSLRDIRRDQEDEARRREMTTSARNTSSSTIGAGGLLTLDGGGIDVTADGVIRVNGQGYEPEGNNVYKVTAEVTSMDKAGYINYRSPGIRFTSDIYGSEESSIYSREGNDIWLEAGSSVAHISTGSAYMVASSPDDLSNYKVSATGSGGGVQSTDVANGIQYGVVLYEREQSSGNYELLTGGEFISGHDGIFLQGAGKWSRLRTRYGGKVWLESKGTGTASVEMPGDGRVLIKGATDVTGSFTVNGQPVGGAPEWIDVKNKPPSFPPSAHSHPTSQVTGLDTALAGKAATTFVNGLKRRFRRVPGTGLGTSIASSTTNWTSFGSTVTVPADLFGVGVPYIITAYAQAAGWPASSAVFSLRLLFSGTQPDGAKTNSPNGPHNATTTVSYDFEVTTSREVIVAAQAQSAFGSSAIGQGADQAFYTVTATPYTAL